MKYLFFILLLLNIQGFSQTTDFRINIINKHKSFNYQFVNINNETLSVNNKTSCVFKPQLLQKKYINLAIIQNKKCSDGPGLFVFVPLVGLYFGYQAFASFRAGDKTEGYVFAGSSVVLITVPVSYFWYCSKQ